MDLISGGTVSVSRASSARCSRTCRAGSSTLSTTARTLPTTAAARDLGGVRYSVCGASLPNSTAAIAKVVLYLSSSGALPALPAGPALQVAQLCIDHRQISGQPLEGMREHSGLSLCYYRFSNGFHSVCRRPASNPEHQAIEPKHWRLWSFRNSGSRQPSGASPGFSQSPRHYLSTPSIPTATR